MYGEQTNGIREMLEYRISTGNRYRKRKSTVFKSSSGGIGRRTVDREKVADHGGENHVRCKSLPTAFGFVGVATTNTSRLHRK